MNITLTGVAETISAFGAVVTGIGTMVMQFMSLRSSKKNGQKIDANTELTKVTASKVDDVHTAQIAATGAYQTLKPPESQ